VKLALKLMITVMVSIVFSGARGYAQESDDSSSETKSSDQSSQRTSDAPAAQKAADPDPQNTAPAGKLATNMSGFTACFDCKAREMAEQASDAYCNGGSSVSLTASSFNSQSCMTSGRAAPAGGQNSRVNK
jgi:hypothetical protein